MSIVCGTDFSDPAARSVAAAFAIARRFREKLFAAHVLDGSVTAVPDENVRWSVKERTLELLREEAKRFGDTGEGAFEAAALSGEPDVALTEFGSHHEARFLVVSSLGKGAGPWWKLGGTTERLAAASRLPVLAVRDPGPFEAWSRGERPLRILLAVTRDQPSEAAARWVAEWRKAGPCDLAVATFYDPARERERLGLGGPVSSREPRPEAEKALKREMREILGDPSGAGSLEFLALAGPGDPAAHIVRLAASLPVDLVVVGTHLRRGLDRLWRGSVSHGVLSEAPCAVACVPCGAAEPPAVPEVRAVLAATDFSEAGNRAVALAHLLAPVGGVVHVVHVVELDDDRLRRTQYAGFVAGKSATPEERTRLSQALSARLSELVPARTANRGVETRLEIAESDDAAAAILQASRRLGADLVCVGFHAGREPLFGSTAGALLRDGEVPVLVVPELRRT